MASYFAWPCRAGERLLHTPDNPISLALTLTTLDRQQPGLSNMERLAEPGRDDMAEPNPSVSESRPLQSAVGDRSPQFLANERGARTTLEAHAEPATMSASNARGGKEAGPSTAAACEVTRGGAEADQEVAPADGCGTAEDGRRQSPKDGEASTPAGQLGSQEEGSGPARTNLGGADAGQEAEDAPSIPTGRTRGGGRKPSPALTFFGSMLFARYVRWSPCLDCLPDDREAPSVQVVWCVVEGSSPSE